MLPDVTNTLPIYLRMISSRQLRSPQRLGEVRYIRDVGRLVIYIFKRFKGICIKANSIVKASNVAYNIAVDLCAIYIVQ